MPYTVSGNSASTFSVQINGPVNFSANKTLNEKIKRTLASKVGPSPRKKEVNRQTCNWLEENTTFRTWISDDKEVSGLLWICGGPGKGKSHLATRLASQLGKHHITLSYFCDTRDILRSTELAVVLALLNQLLELEDPMEMYWAISDKFSGIGQDLFSDVYIADLWECFGKMVRKKAQKGQIYLIVDGLDECDSHSRCQLTRQLRSMCDENRQGEKNLVKILILSRPLDLHHRADLMIDLHEDENLKWTKEDIRTIVKESCQLELGKEKFCDILTKRANGTFLWVTLAISILNDRSTQQKIVDGDPTFLDKLLPIELDSMYNRMLINILERLHGKSQYKATMKIFRCLTFSLRPLTKEELGSIAAADSPTVDDTLQAFQHILSITRNDSADEAIELIHLSLREFLARNSSTLMPEDICWSIWPRLSSTASSLREKKFRLWFLDHLFLTTMFIYCQGLLYQHRIFTLGFCFVIASRLIYQKQRSSLFIALSYRVLEGWVNKTVMAIFRVREKEMHCFMFERCVALMDDPIDGLKRDICDIEYPGQLQQKATVDKRCRHIRYPSRYWILHLKYSVPKPCEIDQMYNFLGKHFLHWLEAMSIFGLISEAAGELEMLQEIIQKDTAIDVTEFLRDARRFTLKTRHVAGIDPLQIYYSGLIFAPMKSIIRNKFKSEIHRIYILPKVDEFWSAEMQSLEGHFRAVNSVVFSPDSQAVASGSNDGTLRVWDVTTGKVRQNLNTNLNFVLHVAFSPDGQTIATSSIKGDIVLWIITTGKKLQTFKGLLSSSTSMAFSTDGHMVVSGLNNGSIELRNITTGRILRTLKGHSNVVLSVAISPDGQTIASGSFGNTFCLWDVTTGRKRQASNGNAYLDCAMAFSSDSKLLALASNDYNIRLYDVIKGKVRCTLTGHSSFVLSVAFSPDGRTLASGSSDTTIKLWDVMKRTVQQTLRGHSAGVSSVAFSPDGQKIASGSDDKTIRLWDIAKANDRQTLREHSNRIRVAIFSPNGQTLALGSDEKTVRLWDVIEGKVRQTLKGHSSGILSVAFSPDGQMIASGSGDNTARLWDSITGKERHTLKAHSKWVRSVAFSSNSKLLASSSDDGTIRLWDAITGKLRQTFQFGWVWSVAFSPDGQRIASGSRNNNIQLWDTVTGERQQTLVGHSHDVFSVVFSPDGQTLASGSADNTVGLWDVTTGKQLQVFNGHSMWVQSVTFPDSQTLASGSDDQTIRLWDIPTGKERQSLVPLLNGDPDPRLSIATDWVAFGGENILWLPSEYRAFSCWACYKGTLALGYSDGRFLVVGISGLIN